jgi:hypothetical protein
MEDKAPQSNLHFYNRLCNSNEIWGTRRPWFLDIPIIPFCSLGFSSSQLQETSMDRFAPRERGRIHHTQPWSRTHQEAKEAMDDFFNTTTPNSWEDIENLENEACHRREITLDVIFDVKVIPLFLYTGTTCAKYIKYICVVNLYLHVKTIPTEAITARDASHTDMARKIEYIQQHNQLQEKKINIVVVKLGIAFRVVEDEITQVSKETPPSSS